MNSKLIIIDNYDSFTHLLKQYCGELGGRPEVFMNDEISVARLKKLKPTHLLLSPGPGTVERQKDVGAMFAIIKAFHKKIPILGVCLGHQALGKFFGLKITRAKKIMHGKTSRIYHDKKGLFQGLPNPFEAMRYHSLLVSGKSPELEVTAWTRDREIMAIQHKTLPLYGLQFHPESVGSLAVGKKILKRFLNA